MSNHKTITDYISEQNNPYNSSGLPLPPPPPQTPVATLRDQFAMAALTGLLANPKLQPEIAKTGGAYGGWIEGSAWSWADAMMEKRK
jgi:hypothetical protein